MLIWEFHNLKKMYFVLQWDFESLKKVHFLCKIQVMKRILLIQLLISILFSACLPTNQQNHSSGKTPSPPNILFILTDDQGWGRSEEHTSELQSRGHLVC